MESVLITGAGPNGVTGRLIKEALINKYNILSPSSTELDLTKEGDVSYFFQQNSIDYVIHCATFRPISYIYREQKNLDELECNLRMFYALAAQNRLYKKMIYLGSGAEFDKSHPIINVPETDFGKSIPNSKYGLGKYIMNLYSQKSENIYNFRLFGTINKYERPTKNVISNLCVKALKGLPLELNQNCRFSFLYINDLIPIVEYGLKNKLRYHDYNVTMNNSYLLSEIAETINIISGNKLPIIFKHKGLNLEYSACNDRLIKEINPQFSSFEKSIEEVYNHHRNHQSPIDWIDIDSRWTVK